MFTIYRLGSPKLASQMFYFTKPKFLTLVRHVTIKPSKYKPPPSETHDQYNMRIGRPQSPHLAIYAVQLQSTLSITHRMTGMALSGYFALFGILALILPEKLSYYLDLLQDMNIHPALIYPARFILAFPLCYHVSNGTRHLIWDLGVLLSMKAVYLTAYIMLASTFTLTAIAVALL